MKNFELFWFWVDLILSWLFIVAFLKISGPALPKPLYGHSSLSQGNNLYIVGGLSSSIYGYQYSNSIYQLSCNNGEFTWDEIKEKLQTAREYFVADFAPN